ncbi:MAG: plastocyanin domain-containing protein [Cellvibrionaceae bacterium]|jgi:plastocyanin domain-containing protein
MLIINIAGLLLIALIVWWFWLYKPKATQLANNDVVILVENGIYTPSRIKLPANTSIALEFLRKDNSPCAEMLLIPDLCISEALPLNKSKKIVLPAMTAGKYNFHCQMQMYRGQLIVD